MSATLREIRECTEKWRDACGCLDLSIELVS